ncbi:MAG: NUDIX domain-containing protein [Patescibacteria group bacterium]
MPHIHEKIDFTVEVFIVYNNTVLLRKHDKYKLWLSVGGHIELDEDPNQAAVREVKEEVSLDIEIAGTKLKFNEDNYEELLPPRFLNRHRINESHEHVTMVYFAKTETDRIVQGSDEASESLRWFTAKELDDPQYGIKESVRHCAKSALEELSST